MGHNDVINTATIHPRDDNDADIGTVSKRYKTIHYVTLDPAPVDALALAKTGGIMSGPIDMGAQVISNVSAIQPSSTAVTIGLSAAGITGSVAIGNLATANNASVALGPGATVSGTGSQSIAIGYNAISSGDVANTVVGATAGAASRYCVVIGQASSVGAASDGSVVLGAGAVSSNPDAHCLGANITNTVEGSLLIAANANVRANTTTCNLGTVALPFQTLYLNGSVAGPTNSRTADNIVSNVGTSTDGHVALLSGNSGKVVADSGIVASKVVTGSPGSIGLPSGRIVIGWDGTYGVEGHELEASSLAYNLDATPVVEGDLPKFAGVGGRWLTTSGIAAPSLVQNTGGAVTSGHLVQFSDTGGRLITTAGAPLSNYLLRSAGVMTGDLDMGTHDITGVGALVAATVASAGTAQCTGVVATSPCALQSYCLNVGNVLFSAGDPRPIDVGTFTELVDPTGSFSLGSGGIVTYTGPTRRVKIDCTYCFRPPASLTSLYTWIDHNAALAMVAPNYHEFTAAVLGITPYTVTGVYSVVSGDTLQLAGTHDASANILFFSATYTITCIC